MAKTKYEVIEAGNPKAPPRSLIRVSGYRNLIASLDAFGPSTYKNNVVEMQKPYSHPQTGKEISFREPTTAESIIISAYDFAKRAKRQIFNPNWLQAGRIVRTSEGVYANPPKDEQGNFVVDERTLKSYLDGIKPMKVGNGKVWIVPDSRGLKDFGFAEYDSFKQGIYRDVGDFVEGGLARVLEHSHSADNLGEIASEENYPEGVKVRGFDSVSNPILKVAALYSGRDLGNDGLYVNGDGWLDGSLGFAFGVLD